MTVSARKSKQELNIEMMIYIYIRGNSVWKIRKYVHLKPEQIKSIEITNPIDLAGDVSGKEFILDINVIMNDDTLINLEMQVANEHNWPERSLIYLCRAFDQLERGQKYEEILPAIHIGFLDFNLFPGDTEFYSTYRMLNVRTHALYSDKFTLSVVQLNKTEYATEEDKAYGIDYWAKIFKAKTWEELKMLAENNEYMEETVEALYVANADEIVRQQCRAREDAERRERTLERDNKKLKDENAGLKDENAGLRDENAELKDELADYECKQKLTEILVSQKRFKELEVALADVSVAERLYRELGLK